MIPKELIGVDNLHKQVNPQIVPQEFNVDIFK
jgi:hypothetical protein